MHRLSPNYYFALVLLIVVLLSQSEAKRKYDLNKLIVCNRKKVGFASRTIQSWKMFRIGLLCGSLVVLSAGVKN